MPLLLLPRWCSRKIPRRLINSLHSWQQMSTNFMIITILIRSRDAMIQPVARKKKGKKMERKKKKGFSGGSTITFPGPILRLTNLLLLLVRTILFPTLQGNYKGGTTTQKFHTDTHRSCIQIVYTLHDSNTNIISYE